MALVWSCLVTPLQTTAHVDNGTTGDSLVSQVRMRPRTRNPRFRFEDSSNLDCASQQSGSNESGRMLYNDRIPAAEIDTFPVNLRFVLSCAKVELTLTTSRSRMTI